MTAPRRTRIEAVTQGRIIRALASLLHAANDLAPEDDPDRFDMWRAEALAARAEYDALCDEVRAARAARERTPDLLPAGDAERWERGQSHFCLTCGKLPPHEGASAICPACYSPNGTCSCAGCALIEPYRLRLEVLAEEAEKLAIYHNGSKETK